MAQLAGHPLEPHDDGGRDCCYPLASSGETQPVAGGRRHGDRRTRSLGEYCLGFHAAGREAGSVPNKLDGDVPDLETCLAHNSCRFRQEGNTGGACVLGPIGAEIRAEVARPGGREQGVSCCVRHGVAVGMAGQPALSRPFEPSQPERSRLIGGGKGVDVDANAGAWNIGGHCCSLAYLRA